MDDLTGFQRDLLYAVAGKPQPSGMDVKEDLEDYYESPINHGRLYPNLDTLVDKGLLDKEREEDLNQYSLTDRGVEELLERDGWENDRLMNNEQIAGRLEPQDE